MADELRRSRARLGLLAFLARRSLFGSRLTFVLLVVAIAAGAGFQIPNTANLTGWDRALLEDGLTHGAGDIRVEPKNGGRFADGDAMAAKVGIIAGARSVTPVLVYAGAIGSKGKFLGTPVYGIEPAPPLRNPDPFHLTKGAVLAKGDAEGVLLGSSFAKRLGVGVGDAVELRVIFGAAGMAVGDDNLGRFSMKVRGIVAGSAGGYRFVFVDRGFLAKESGEPKSASAIVVHLADHDLATAQAAAINAALPEVDAIGWREDDPYLTSYLNANATVAGVSYAMVVAAVSVPMWALLYIHVLKRRREIGILASLGFGRGEIFAIYLLQSLVVAVIGCVIGAVLGYALIRYFQGHPIFEWESLVVRPVLSLAAFTGPAITIVITALIAGAYPAWRAARTDPAQVLRRIE